MGLGSIVKDIGGILDTASNLFGGGGKSKYPARVGQTSVNNITNLPLFNDKNWKSSRDYAFQVYEVDDNNNLKDAGSWKEYRLQINPQDLQQDEIFAIEVTPTFRGVMVEHQGSVLKDITISGTTGVSPMRREGGALLDSGRPILQSGISGYEEFHELRSYFRVYVEAKRDSIRASKLRMVFKNFKDSEFLFVEPQRFTMRRSSSRPFMYDYSISLKGIGVASVTPKGPNLFESIDNMLENVQNYFDTATKIINGSIGIITRFQRDVSATLLGPLRSIQQAISAVRGGGNLLSTYSITRKTIDDLRVIVGKIRNDLSDGFGINMSAFNTFAGRSATLAAAPGRDPTYQERRVLNAMNLITRGLILISRQNDLFEEDVFTINSGVLSTYNNSISLDTPQTVRQSSILGSDNIQTIAAREMGDADKYREIILLNNLKPPYISAAGGNGVLKPGDKILIPQQQANLDTGVLKNKGYNISKGMGEAEIGLGVDIRITDQGDLSISNTKDLDLLAGNANMAQAITLKLLIEQGGLKRHLEIGTNLQIGSKGEDLSEIRSQIVSSFTSDPRIESLPFIELKRNGGTVQINAVVKMKALDQPVPLPITLNI